MTDKSEDLKAKARALRNKQAGANPNAIFGGDEHSRRGKKSAAKVQTGVKTSFRKPSV